jgi:uncharacterized membrane protein YeaQ/YmgE (transglycosylase-associated protein family)
MNILTWLVAGGAVGWGATVYLGATERQVLIFNVVVGVVGAAIGGWLLGPTLGVGPGFTGFGVIVSAIGAAIALLVAYFVQKRVAG